MRATFLLTLETEGDTDLPGIAEEISAYVEDRFTVISCHPWQRDATLDSLGHQVQAQTAVPLKTTK